MECNSISVKDLILDESSVKALNEKKKSTRQVARYTYNVVMQSGCDFAVERTRKGRKERVLLVVLVSQEQYYIEKGNVRKKLTKSNLRSFLSGLANNDVIKLPDVTWIDGLYHISSYTRTIVDILGRNNFLSDTVHRAAHEMMRKGYIYCGNTDFFDRDGTWGEKRYSNRQRIVDYDFAPYEDNNDIFGRFGVNGPDDGGFAAFRTGPYNVQMYGGYNPSVGTRVVGLNGMSGGFGSTCYDEYQATFYDINPTLYRFMLRFLSERLGITNKELLTDVITDPERSESLLFQSFLSFALIGKAFGIELAKDAMKGFMDSGIDDIIPYPQLCMFLYGNTVDINYWSNISSADKDTVHSLNGKRFLKYLLEEPVRQGYERSMNLFLYQWGQVLFLQDSMDLPTTDKYPKCLASFAVKLISKARDYSDLIEKKAWDKAADHSLSLEYSDDKYKIIVPHSHLDLAKEADQQGNCVRTYESQILNMQTRVLFLRYSDPGREDVSLVTIEVDNDNRVQQVKAKYNKVPKAEIWKFVSEWEKTKGLIDVTGLNPFVNELEQLFDTLEEGA